MKKYGEKRKMNVIFYKNRVIFVEKLRNKYSFTNYSKTDTIKPKKNMEQNQNGSKAYLISIVMVAVLGGLLFGYDTAVISGAEKGLQAFFKGASDFEYTDFMHGFTSSSALIGCIIGSALSGLFASNLGQYHSWRCYCHRSCLPVDLQLYCQLNLRSAV